jgi:hypothetical protein
MGILMPETCRTVSVRQSNKVLRLIVASSWVFYLSNGQYSALVGEIWNSQILMDSLIASLPTRVIGNAITFGFYLLQLHNLVADIGPPDTACITHRTSNELLIKQDTVSNRHTHTSPIKDRA